MSDKPEIKSIIATDCGSTTTKAILIEKMGDEYRQTIRGEAPTTVEAPFDDVTIGVLNAVTEVQELTNQRSDGGNPRKILSDGTIQRCTDTGKDDEGVDLYLSTSSAGGGLQMAVAGVVRKMTGDSAQRAALGAGAIVMDVMSVDDGRKPYERVARLRALRPDIVLLSGGTDGGTRKHVIELTETILQAEPKPRFGASLDLPVIYAGNKMAADEVVRLLSRIADVQVVDNIRPTLEQEVPQPARDAIHESFLKHVMSHAPGYHKLMDWTDEDIMSTPNAVGSIIEQIAHAYNIQVLAVDIGGATTDIFSVFERPAIREGEKAEKVFNRTVSANLGMSYSICNVLLEAGADNIMRWLPMKLSEAEMRNRLRNKMIRPTTIPQTLEDLMLEHAVAREALRLALIHHKSLARGLEGVSVEDFDVSGGLGGGQRSGKSIVDMFKLDMMVGSGGVLSHTPSRKQSALMVTDAFQPQGFTSLTVDSIFMMPQLGVLSKVMPEAAAQVFERDCIIYLGTSIAPVGKMKKGKDGPVMEVNLEFPDGRKDAFTINWGEMKVVPATQEEEVRVNVKPAKGFDIGEGRGKEVTRKARGGVVGLMFDGRGRPLEDVLPKDPEERVAFQQRALDAFDLPYPGKA